jgi:hypothetical protein
MENSRNYSGGLFNISNSSNSCGDCPTRQRKWKNIEGSEN